MFCTSCGTPAIPQGVYCTRCGQPLKGPTAVYVEAPPPAWRMSAAALGIAAAVCTLAALFPVYGYQGADATAQRLKDSSSTVAFNAVFIGSIVIAALLAFLSRTSRFGAGMLVGAGLLTAAQFISDTTDFLRSGTDGSATYYSPGPGYWWGITSCALCLASAVLALIALRRCGALRIRATRVGIFWAITGMVLAIGWLIGTWMPWQKTTLTSTVADATKTVTLSECCSLSDMPGQFLAEAALAFVLLIAVALIGACISSAATASGAILGSAFCAGASIVPGLMNKAPSIADVASAWDTVTEDQLRQAQAATALHHLPGLWLTAASVVGLILLATARGMHGMVSAAGPDSVVYAERESAGSPTAAQVLLSPENSPKTGP